MSEPKPFSFRAKAEPGQSTEFLCTLPGTLNPLSPDAVNDRWITAVELYAQNAHQSDRFFAEIIDKNGVLGMGENFILGKLYDDHTAMTLSPTVVAFRGIFVRPNEWYETKFEPVRIPAGSTLRLIYKSAGQNNIVYLFGVIHWEKRDA